MPVAEFFGGGDGYGETGIEVLEYAILVFEAAVGSSRFGGFSGECSDRVYCGAGSCSGKTSL